MLSRIGSKQSDSLSPKQALVEPMNNAALDSRSGGLQSAELKTMVDLVKALRERLAIVRDEKSSRDPEKHLARLQAVSEKIDKLAAALPRPTDPQLAHYLQRKSYDKALEFLENTL